MSSSVWYIVPKVVFRASYTPQERALLENEIGHITHLDEDRYSLEYNDEGNFAIDELEPFLRKAKGNNSLVVNLHDGAEVYASDSYAFGNGRFEQL